MRNLLLRKSIGDFFLDLLRNSHYNKLNARFAVSFVEVSDLRVNEKGTVQSGRAVFLPLHGDLEELRRETKRVLLDGAELRAFVVCREEIFYPRLGERLLLTEPPLVDLTPPLGGEVSGCERGALRCMALWDEEYGDGALLHRDVNGIWGAYLPVMTLEQARREQEISRTLVRLAADAGEIPIRMAMGARCPSKELKAWLLRLAEML